MTAFKLRDYQRECIGAVFRAWHKEGLTRPAAVLPTGAGKTVVFSALVDQWQGSSEEIGSKGSAALREKHGARVMVLAHRDELVDQAINKLRATLPAGISVGKVKARDNEISADVMVCSVQTLASKGRRDSVECSQAYAGRVGLIITDECHHAAARSYQAVYAAFPDALHLGVTATMARGDGVGLGSTWEEVVYTRSILWMISKNFLSDVKAQRVEVDDLDTGGVKTSRGDFQAGALGEALEESGFAEAVSRSYREHAADRPGIVFTPTVVTAEMAAVALTAEGIRSAVVSGETPREERAEIYERFRTGEIQVLSNCMVLTEGFDAPWASCAVIARPTQSAPLYTQMVGRVLRPWPGKTDALVLDLVGASDHKIRTLVDLEPGAVKAMRDGETLADAVVREADEGNVPVRTGSIAYALMSRDVDMFGGSPIAWHKTAGGILFIDCGPADGTKEQRRVFLWPSMETPGMWRVAGQRDGRPSGFWPGHGEMDLSMAMAVGEYIAEEEGAFSVHRSARWRKSPPSPAQLAYAQNRGVNTEGMTRGDVSEALSVVTATRALDGMLRRL